MGAMIPLPVMAAPDLSPGAKLCYGVMCQFAGRDGRCFPSERALAEKLRVSERSARSYVAELVSNGYIERERRSRSETNSYFFLWKSEFKEFLLDRQNRDARDRQNPDAKETQGKRITTDSDYGATNLASLGSSTRFGTLREIVAESLGADLSDSALGRVVAAGGGASEGQLVEAIRAALMKTKSPPRRARWFEVAVAEHFDHAAGLRPAVPACKVIAMEPKEAAEMAGAFSSVEAQDEAA